MKYWIIAVALGLGLLLGAGCKSGPEKGDQEKKVEKKQGETEKDQTKSDGKDKGKAVKHEKGHVMDGNCRCREGKPCICANQPGGVCTCPK